MVTETEQTSRRETVSKKLRKGLQAHFPHLTPQDIDSFRVERHRSNYPHASADLVIYDGSGRALIRGREFHGNQVALWM